MINFEGLKENYAFIILETINQVNSTYAFTKRPSSTLHDKISSRDDRIDNLKIVIENECFSAIYAQPDNKAQRKLVRSIHTSAVNLERIADFCVNIVKQMQYLSSPEVFHAFDSDSMFEKIRETLSTVHDLGTEGDSDRKHDRGLDRDLDRILDVCRAEDELDQMYKDNFVRILDELDDGKNARDQVTVLFIFRYLERIGDALLNIGEALMFPIIGERIKIGQFQALQRSLDQSGYTGDMTDIKFKSIWGGRSGARIGRVVPKSSMPGTAPGTTAGSPRESLFKEGILQKIRKEKDNIERWGEVAPGLGPKIFSYTEQDGKASLLVEFLAGHTLDELIADKNPGLVLRAVDDLIASMAEVWSKKGEGAPSHFIEQLESRLDAVLGVHPDFHRGAGTIGREAVLSDSELFARCRKIEETLPAPFTVFIHGDFNLSNIVYNDALGRVRFIDLYRSREADYLQDVSVFLISNFRLPLFEAKHRQLLWEIIYRFYSFARSYAAKQGDVCFESRLTLGLMRSLITSTRFELNQEFARDMYLRGLYLGDKLIRHEGKPWEEFQLPLKALHYIP
jgi:phosphate uptake regulator